MTQQFQDFPCNKCGWCCQRTPCPVGLYLGQTPMNSCTFLRETKPHEFECGLLIDEKNPLKFEALKTLILSGTGCSHIYGPSPISLMRALVKQGLSKDHPQWDNAYKNTIAEYETMALNAEDGQSIKKAIAEFKDFCSQF